MVVLRILIWTDGHSFLAGHLADPEKATAGQSALMDGSTALQVGEAKCCVTIPAVGGSDQGKEGLVSGNGDGLALAERPPYGREAETHGPNFTDIRRTHA
jgi:hypothetical protein